MRKWWGEVFPGVKLRDLCTDACPMLTGIIHYAEGPRGGFSPFDYHTRILQNIGMVLTLEAVLDRLLAFRQEWQLHHQSLVPFDICQSIGLCPDVVIEITKYLLMSDAINAFSINILALLHQAHSKIHLSNPSDRFLEMIPQYVDPRQITSLRITDEFFLLERHFSTLRTFDQLISLTLLTGSHIDAFICVLAELTNVQRLSLWFDDTISTLFFTQLEKLSIPPITHLHIRCVGTYMYMNRYMPITWKATGNKNTIQSPLSYSIPNITLNIKVGTYPPVTVKKTGATS